MAKAAQENGSKRVETNDPIIDYLTHRPPSRTEKILAVPKANGPRNLDRRLAKLTAENVALVPVYGWLEEALLPLRRPGDEGWEPALVRLLDGSRSGRAAAIPGTPDVRSMPVSPEEEAAEGFSALFG